MSESDKKNVTQMVNPPKDPVSDAQAKADAIVKAAEAKAEEILKAAETKAAPAPKRADGKVKIRTLRPIRIGRGEDAKEIPEGVELEVDEHAAKEFCDKVFRGPYDWSGERSDATATVGKIVRAVRVG